MLRQRRPLHRHEPPPGDRRARPPDARRPRRVPATASRRPSRCRSGSGARSTSRDACALGDAVVPGYPDAAAADHTRSSQPSRPTSTTPTLPRGDAAAGRARRRGRDRRDRGRRARGLGARRLVTFEDAERGLCFGRLDLDGVLRPLYVGRRWVHEEQTPIVVNWQAPAARPFYTATVAEPQGVDAPPPVPDTRAARCSTSTTSRSTARPATSSTASPTSCSRSSSAAATSTCATSSRRSRPTSTA